MDLNNLLQDITFLTSHLINDILLGQPSAEITFILFVCDEDTRREARKAFLALSSGNAPPQLGEGSTESSHVLPTDNDDQFSKSTPVQLFTFTLTYIKIGFLSTLIHKIELLVSLSHFSLVECSCYTVLVFDGDW